jgi:hypothetical protein
MLGSAETTSGRYLVAWRHFKAKVNKQSLWRRFLQLRTFLLTGTFLHFDYAIWNFNGKCITQYGCHAFSKKPEQRNKANSSEYEMLSAIFKQHTPVFPQDRERLFALNTHVIWIYVLKINLAVLNSVFKWNYNNKTRCTLLTNLSEPVTLRSTSQLHAGMRFRARCPSNAQ